MCVSLRLRLLSPGRGQALPCCRSFLPSARVRPFSRVDSPEPSLSRTSGRGGPPGAEGFGALLWDYGPLSVGVGRLYPGWLGLSHQLSRASGTRPSLDKPGSWGMIAARRWSSLIRWTRVALLGQTGRPREATKKMVGVLLPRSLAAGEGRGSPRKSGSIHCSVRA